MGEIPVARQRATLAVAAVVTTLVLVGCAPTVDMPQPTPSATRTPTPTPTQTPSKTPEFVAGGTAGQNRPFVEFIIGDLLSRDAQPASLEIVDTLVAGGFDRASMEITEDTTRVGSRADSILFSIVIDGECLLGQVAGRSVATTIGDVLGTGRCLVGRTLSLD